MLDNNTILCRESCLTCLCLYPAVKGRAGRGDVMRRDRWRHHRIVNLAVLCQTQSKQSHPSGSLSATWYQTESLLNWFQSVQAAAAFRLIKVVSGSPDLVKCNDGCKHGCNESRIVTPDLPPANNRFHTKHNQVSALK